MWFIHDPYPWPVTETMTECIVRFLWLSKTWCDHVIQICKMMHVNIVQTLRKIGTIFSFVGGSLKPAKMKLRFIAEQNVAKCFDLMIMWNVRLKFIMDCLQQCLKLNCQASMIFYVQIVLNSSVCSLCHQSHYKKGSKSEPRVSLSQSVVSQSSAKVSQLKSPSRVLTTVHKAGGRW